jgi:chromosome segregation ATPase
MSESTRAPGELAMLREVIQQFHRVLTDWERFLDWVEAQRREMEHLRARLSGLAQEHARLHDVCERLRETSEHERTEHAQLRSAHEALREDYERTRQELRALRLMHERVLREQRDTYEILGGALRRLKS